MTSRTKASKKAGWIITGLSAAIFFAGNLLSKLQDPWFQNLARPSWLTFESLIPVIWLLIWVCATLSAIFMWKKAPRRGRRRAWLLMALYWAIALLTALYGQVVVELRSLLGGFIVGSMATLLVYVLAIFVRPISQKAAWLLAPYLLWGPVGTYLTWILFELNPDTHDFNFFK